MERSAENSHFRLNFVVECNRETRDNNDNGVGRKQIGVEVKKHSRFAGLLISITLLQSCLPMISVMFVGHLGGSALSGASTATSFASVTGFSLLMGMASALDTLCGQSYGAERYRMMGIHMQRAMFVLLLLSIPVAFVWANTKSLLILAQQCPEISEEAGFYALFMIPSLFAYGLLQCLNRFLQTQNIVFPMMLCAGIATLLHFPLCWFLVFKSGLGSRGAALANSISCWINVLLMAIYVKFSSSCQRSWTGFSMEALQNIVTFLKLAIPSAVMVCLEMWSFQMMVLLSGLVPNPVLEISVLSISLNTSAIVWMIPFGLGGAVSTRVSRELGARHPRVASFAVGVVLLMAITEGLVVVSVLILISNIWVDLYSNEIQVIKYVDTMMPFFALFGFLVGPHCVLSGTARGCGLQKTGAFLNLRSYCFAGIPFAIVLTFALQLHIGGQGLLPVVCALVVFLLAVQVQQVVSLLCFTILINWEQEASNAAERVHDLRTHTDIES